MTYFKQLDMTRRQRFLRICLSMLIVLATVLSLTIQASAATTTFGVQDIYELTAWYKANETELGDGSSGAASGGTTPDNAAQQTTGTTDTQTQDTVKSKDFSNVKFKTAEGTEGTLNEVITWNQLLVLYNTPKTCLPDPDTQDEAYRYFLIGKSVVATFKSQAAYNKAVKGWENVFIYDTKTCELGYAEDKEGTGEKMETSFSGTVASAQASATFRDIYDMESWNPAAGVAGDMLSGVYGVVNTVFYVCSQLIMWFFIMQTGFDVLFLTFEPIRPFIGPRDGNGGGGVVGATNNGSGGLAGRIHIPIASHAAAEAANVQVGLGGRDGATAGNPFLTYALKRFPVVLLCAVYIILVANGYWIKVIEWVSGFVVQIINFFLKLGQ